MITEQDLLTIADAYAVATESKPTTVSFRVFGDSKKLSAIRAGKDITVRRLNDALHWFSSNWPENAIWPERIARPIAERSDAAQSQTIAEASA